MVDIAQEVRAPVCETGGEGPSPSIHPRFKGDNIMGADLHIHVFERITEDDLAIMKSSTLGSKYFNLKLDDMPWEEKSKIHKRVGETPNIWIGEVSWLKAALMEDSDTFIPNTVRDISELIGEDLPVVDDEFIDKVVAAFEQLNNTKKEDGVWSGSGYSLANPEEVRTFLEIHKGKKVFQISW